MFFNNLKGMISTYTWASWTLKICVSVGTSSCWCLQVTTITHLYEKLLLSHTPHGKCVRIQTLRQNDLSKQYWLQYVCRLANVSLSEWQVTQWSQPKHTLSTWCWYSPSYMYSPANKTQNVHCLSMPKKPEEWHGKTHHMDCKFKQIIEPDDGYLWTNSHKYTYKNAAFLVFHSTQKQTRTIHYPAY
jgi:hypothetical protein